MLTWDLLELLSHSPIHAKYGPARLRRWFAVPEGLGQMLPFRDPSGALVGVLTWALLSEEAETRFLAGVPLEPADWHSGDRLWVVDFVAPHGHAREILNRLRAAPLGRRPVRWCRTHGTGSIQHIGEARRARLSSSHG